MRVITTGAVLELPISEVRRHLRERIGKESARGMEDCAEFRARVVPGLSRADVLRNALYAEVEQEGKR